MKNLYWVGNRASDIAYTCDEFKGYICLYGETNNINMFSNIPIRKNNSIIDDSSNEFYKSAIGKIVKNDDSAYFMFYNPLVAYKINSPYQQRFICLNDRDIIRLLDDKIQCHSILNQIANFSPFITIYGEDITYNNLKKVFGDNFKFVIQRSKSAAGLGTFILDKDNFKSIKNKYIDANQIYLVSVYQEKSNTFNFHIIMDNKTTLFFPPSYSIMDCINGQMHYRGSSYIDTTKVIGSNNINNAKIMIKNITDFLRKFGYKGIVGFDFLSSMESTFLLELNLRFQGSSNILNKMLKDAGLPSLSQLNQLAFMDNLPTLDMDKINTFYANIFSYNENETDIKLDYELIETFDDNLSNYTKFEHGAYINRKIYGK